MSIHIIEAPDVDLIEPFPMREAKRVFGWLHAYRNIVESDLSPKTPEEFEAYFQRLLPHIRSFGVIDRDNKLKYRHPAPLIGMIAFEPSTPWNCYIHIASNRRAWGSGFMDQAVTTALDEIFATEPTLLRISAFVLSGNGPVKAMIRRIGGRFEGLHKDWVTQNGKPKNVIHFGVTRQEWKRLKTVQPEENKEPAGLETPTDVSNPPSTEESSEQN